MSDNLLGQLKPALGSRHKVHRVGRGSGSGWGETAGRGAKGQKARKGCNLKPGFEGGQTPLARRLPKFGFTNALFKVKYEVVNLDQLNELSTEVVDTEALCKAGLVRKPASRVKVLGRGSLDKKFQVSVHACSQSAQKAIEAAGGSVEVVKFK